MIYKTAEEKLEDVMRRYKTVRAALTGLYNIVSINFTEKDFYHKAALDNLKALNVEIIGILKDSLDPRKVRMEIRDLEYDEAEMEQIFPL